MTMDLIGPTSVGDIHYLVYQFLLEQGLTEAAKEVREQLKEGFQLPLFEMVIHGGFWDEAEKYIATFADTVDDRLSLEEFINEIEKQKARELKIRQDKEQELSLEEIMQVDMPEPNTKEEVSASRAALLEKMKTMVSNHNLFQDTYIFRHLQCSSLWKMVDKRVHFGVYKLTSERATHYRSSQSYLARKASKPDDIYMDKSIIGIRFPDADNERGHEIRSQMLIGNSLMEEQDIVQLAFMNSGKGLVALLTNGFHIVWSWPNGMATAREAAELKKTWPPRCMINELSDDPMEVDISFSVLTKDDSLILSGSGGKVSLFELATFKTKHEFMSPPPAVTCIAFLHGDELVAIGKEDSTIEIYILKARETLGIHLHGHTNRITSLACSSSSRLLASSDADAQVIVWSTEDFEVRARMHLQIPEVLPGSLLPKTDIQFHNDERHLLIVHETQLAIYEAETLGVQTFQWIAEPLAAPIHHARFSCDCQLIYSSFLDGSLRVFWVDPEIMQVQFLCRIKPSAYIPKFSSLEQYRFPAVIATHPTNPQLIAVGLTDGQVYAIEPLSNWGNSARLKVARKRTGSSFSCKY